MKHDLHYVEELFHDDSGIVGRFLPVDSIKPNPDQPRRVIGDLTELVASIREKGVLEPLLVRRFGEGYQIIAGERRWRACKEIGLSLVPCIEKDVDDREMLELALIENLQRKDLSCFEEAEGLQALVERFNYTHAQVAQVIGKSRTSVTESLSLNQIPAEVRDSCRLADITSKSLLLQVVRQPDLESMKRLVHRIVKENLTREQMRDEKSAAKKANPAKRFVYESKGENYSLSIHFNKPNVTNDEIVDTLQNALDKLK